MTSTPRTFQAVLKSKQVMMTDPIAIECARLETEVASLTRAQTYYRAILAGLTVAVVVLGLLLEVTMRQQKADGLTITNHGGGTITNLSMRYYSHPTP